MLNGITDAMNMNLGKLQEMVRSGRTGVLQSMELQRVGHDDIELESTVCSLILAKRYVIYFFLIYRCYIQRRSQENYTPVDKQCFVSGAVVLKVRDPGVLPQGTFGSVSGHVGEGCGNPLQYSCLENPMGGGAWQATVPGVSKSQTQLSDFTLSLFTFMCWRRTWQPIPVFLPGESQGRGSLVGCHLWGRTESDTTEVTQQQLQQNILGFYNLENATKLGLTKK